MSDNFEAIIKAKLDMSELERQIAELQKRKEKIKLDVEINTSDIEKQISGIGKGNTVKLGVDTSQATDGLKKTQSITEQTVGSVGKLNTGFKSFVATGAKIGLVHTGLREITQAAKQAVSSVKEIDESIVDLQMATGGSYSETKNMVNTYNKLGQTIGATTTEITDGASDWLRQGKSISETNDLITNSMILSKVANLDSAKSTEYLTAGMKAYKVETQNVLDIVDKLTSIDLVSATDAGGLAEAMSRTAVSANLAGVDMSKLLGYLSVTGEVTQKSMSSVGESYKSIFQRMSNIKAGNLSLIGDDGTTEDLSNVETVLTALDIKLRDSKQEFRNFGDVLDEVGGNWKSFSSVQQSAISTAFAGIHHSENFKVLMENYATASQYAEVANQSQGTALEKFDDYVNGIGAKTKSLQATFESLATGTISRDMYAGILDASKAVLEFVDATGLLKGALAGIAVAGALKGITSIGVGLMEATTKMKQFSMALDLLKVGNIGTDQMDQLLALTDGLSNSQLKAVISSQALSTTQRMTILTSQGLSQAEAQVALQTMGLATSQGTAAVATTGLGTALKGLWATLMANPILLVATAVTAGVMAWNSYKRSVEEAVAAAKEAVQSWTDQNASLEEQKAKVRELHDQLNSGTLTDQEAYDAKSQLLDIQNQLIETYGKQAEGINLVSDAYESELAKLNQLTEAEAKRIINENESGFIRAKKEMTEEREYHLGDGSYANAGLEIANIAKNYEDKGIDLTDFGDGSYTIQFIGDASQASEVINDFENEVRGLQDVWGEENFSINNVLDNSTHSLTKVNKVLEEYQDMYNQYLQADMFSKGTGQGSAADVFNRYTKSIQEYNDALLQTGDNADEGVKTAAENFGSVSKEVDNIIKKNPEYQSMFDDVKSQLMDAEIDVRNFNKELTSGSLKDFAKEIKKADLSDIDLQSMVDGALPSWDALKAKAKEYDVSIDTVIDKLIEMGVVSGRIADEIQEAFNLDATPLLDEYNTASESANKGDNYKQYKDILEKTKELYDSGEIGTDDFKKGATIFSPTGMDDAVNFAENYAKAKRYLTDDSKGVKNFLSDLEEKGFAELTKTVDENGKSLEKWSYNIDDLESAATDMGMSFEWFMSTLGRLDDYGFANNFFATTDEGVAHISDLYSQLAKEQEKLDELTAAGKYETSEGMTFGSQTAIDAQKAKIEELNGSIRDSLSLMEQLINKSAEDYSTEVSSAKKAMGALAEQRQKVLDEGGANSQEVAKMIEDQITSLSKNYGDIPLTADFEVDVDGANAKVDKEIAEMKAKTDQPLIMNFDLSGFDGEIQNAIGLLQQLYDLNETKEIQQKIGADTSEVETKISTVEGKIKSINPKIQIGLGIDDLNTDEILGKINADEINLPTLKGTADYELGESPEEVPDASGKANFTLGTYPITVPDVEAKVNYRLGNVEKPSGGGILGVGFQAQGNAHAHGTPIIKSAHFSDGVVGTAFVNGTWGEKNNTTALTGELGEELVVRGNKFFTIGKNGAEFAHLKKGDIVFNHLQTREILTKGYTNSRAKALFNGNALAHGNARAGIGGGGGTFGGGAAGNKLSDSSTNANNTATNNNTKATDENTESTEKSTQTIDNVETRLNYLADKTKAFADKISQIADKITDYISFTMKSSLLKKQIKTTDKQINSKEKEITGNQKGYKKYINKADSVGLSEAWKKKVQKGEYSINEIDTSTDEGKKLAEKIQLYEDWYGKAKNCKQAIVDLRGEVINLQNSQLELFEQWANIPIERAEKKIEKLKSSYKGLDALNAQSSAASQGGSTQAVLLKIQNKAVTDSKKEYNKTQKSTSKADNKVDKTAKTLKKSNLTKKEKKKVNAGKKISTKKLSGTKKKRAVAYNKSLENQKIAEKQEKTAKTVYNTAKDNYSMIRDNYVPGEEWRYQNLLADEEVRVQQEVNKENQNSYNKTIKNAQKSEVKKNKAEKKKNNSAKKLSNKKSITKNLNNSQEKALKAGKTVSTKGITDKKTLAAIKKHNAAVKAATKATKELKIAEEAEDTAASNAAQSQAELAQAMIEAEKAKFDNVKASYETELALKSAESALTASQNKLKQATGKTYADSDLSKADWEKEINGKKAELATKEAESAALKKQLQASVASGKIKTGTAEWKEMQTAILEADTAVNELNIEVADLYDTMRSDLLYRDLERAIEAAENLQKAIGTLKGLINDDMMFNDDGKLTDFGLTKLSLEMDDYKSNVSELESALEAMERAKQQYASKDETGNNYSESDYLADIKEYQDKAQSALSTLESSRSSIMSILKNQAKAELDALNKVIDKRKEALKRKKEYYDYDKKLKEQSKDIQALQAQALALEGSTRSDDLAELARIKAQLAEAQEALDDTIKDHVYELQIQGLDDLSEQLTEDYEKYIKALSQNLDDMSKAFQSVETTVTYAANTIDSTIQSILASYGVAGLTANSVGYDKPYASGTKSVPYDMTALTQENGSELIITKDGILTPLEAGDGVIPAEMTKRLWDMAKNYDYVMNPGAKIIEATSFDFSKIPTGTQVQSITNDFQYVINVQGDVTKNTLPDLKTILKESSKYTIKEITRDLSKGGYKPGRY